MPLTTLPNSGAMNAYPSFPMQNDFYKELNAKRYGFDDPAADRARLSQAKGEFLDEVNSGN